MAAVLLHSGLFFLLAVAFMGVAIFAVTGWRNERIRRRKAEADRDAWRRRYRDLHLNSTSWFRGL